MAAPASKTEITVEDEVQLNAGTAKPFSFAKFRRAHAVSPVTTPGFIPGMSQ